MDTLEQAHREHTPECDKQTGNMTFSRFPKFLLLLLLHQVYSEDAEPTFKAKGSVIEMGYCFGVDYIAVYRSAPEGNQLLGNSSADNTPITPPRDLQGRIHINKQEHLLGLQISNLTHMDSGIYKRECWQNQTLISHHTHQLSVCNEEVASEEILVKEEGGRTELLCNSTYAGLEGTSVRWYHELYPSYKLILFLDSSVSLDPLGEELQGVVEARDSGALLLLNNSVLKNNHQFYCLVIKGKNCLSFQNMYLQDHSESRDIFASQGDRVVLNCPSDGNDQQWETPMGRITGSSVKNNQMYILFGNKSEDFSLLIPAVSDQHSGDYSCISSSLEVQYLLVLCPKKESHIKGFSEGSNVVLHCDVGKGDFQRVQWHRRDPSGDYEVIHDSNDETVPIPVDLSGRLILSENGTVLTISHVEVQDERVYWCVVLGGPEFLEEDYDYEGDYDEEDTGEEEFSDDRCIFKQETILSLESIGKTRTILDLKPVPFTPVTTKHETSPTAAPNVTAYAVGAGLVGLLVVGVIAVVIVMKRRAKASPKPRETASRSGLNTTKDIKMNVDPGCTEMLRGHNDEYCA